MRGGALGGRRAGTLLGTRTVVGIGGAGVEVLRPVQGSIILAGAKAFQGGAPMRVVSAPYGAAPRWRVFIRWVVDLMPLASVMQPAQAAIIKGVKEGAIEVPTAKGSKAV